MVAYSSYPTSLDDSATLPQTTDRVTKVVAEVVNRLRSAVLNIEVELGEKPSGTSSTVRDRLDHLESFAGNSVSELISDRAKIRVFRSVNQSGNVPDENETAIWDSQSSLITPESASITSNTKLSPSKEGMFYCSAQMTLTPTAGSVSGVIVEIVKNGTDVIHTFQDNGAIWSVAVERSLNFFTKLDLTVTDTVEVRWRHSGSSNSSMELVSGDSKSWFSIVRVSK